MVILQSLWERLVYFAQNDMLITLSVMGGGMLVAGWHPGKPSQYFRIALSLLGGMLWMILARLPSVNSYVVPLVLARYLGLYLVSVLAVIFSCEVGGYSALYAVTISYSIQSACEHLIEIPRGLIPDFPLLLDRGLLFLLMVGSFVAFCSVAVWHGKFQRYNAFEQLDRRVVVSVAATVVGLYIIMDVMARPIQGRSSAEATAMMNLLLAICSLLTVIVATCFCREAETDRRAEIAMHMLAEERERYQREKSAQDAINIRCHDIRHQIAALGQEGYRSSLKELDKLVRIYDDSVNTGSTALDVVLSEKMLVCRTQNIQLTCLANGEKLKFLPDGDIYALFGNILDNAINAVKDIPEQEERFISLTVRTEGGFLLIEEENRYRGEMEFVNGLPQTTNEDRVNHGFGMQSIRALTERYEGSLQISAEDGQYSLSLMFPLYD